MAWTTYLGVNAKAYYNSGNYAVPTWVNIDLIRNLTSGVTFGEWNSSARGSLIKTQEAVLADISIQGDMLYQPSNTAWGALKTQFFAGTSKDMAFMDSTIGSNTANGIRGSMSIFDFSREEQLEEGLMNKLTFKPSRADNAAAHVSL